jgi:enamine deaminase RidA (YjgF/YER057c/UK114 family)
MAVEYRTVDGLAEPPGYSHVAIARGDTLVFTAGAVPLDDRGELVGAGDVEAQTQRALANLLRQLEAGGAVPPMW